MHYYVIIVEPWPASMGCLSIGLFIDPFLSGHRSLYWS